MKRRQFLKQAGVIAALPLVWRGALANGVAEAASKPTGTHKILSANVRVDVPADAKTGDSWKDRREMCGDIIKAQKADLIGYQECQSAHLEYLKSRMPEYDSYALSHAPDYFHPINAIMYLRSRYELISCGGFWFSETPHVAGSKGWDTMNPRLVNWVHLRECSSKKEFRYWNTHLDHRGQQAREHGAAMIVEASAVLPKDFPQILSGDMNAAPDNPAIKTFNDSGWIDTYVAVNGPKETGPTAHGFKGPKTESKHKIDWIFCRGPVKPLAAEIIREGRNGHYPSDHYFVSAEVEL